MKKLTLSNSKTIAKYVIKLMLDKKASNITVIYVDKVTTLTDIFLICTANSDAQAKAITNNIQDNLIKQQLKPLHIEGYQYLKWVLMDYPGITINIFQNEYRDYYNIERLWADNKIETVKESVNL